MAHLRADRWLGYLRRRLGGKRAGRRGAVAIMVGLALPVLIGAAGLAADVGLWYRESARLQMAADAGAMGAARLLQNSAAATADYVAAASAEVNGVSANHLIGTLLAAPAVSVVAGSSVTVTLSSQSDRFFTALFSATPVTLSATAMAGLSTTAAPCVMALGKNVPIGIEVENEGTITATNCSVFSNSATTVQCDATANPSTASIYVRNGSITAQSVGAAGTVCDNTWNGGSVISPAGTSDAASQSDPHAGLAAPPAGSTCQPSSYGWQNNGVLNLNPGTYCGGLTIGNGMTVNFAPGTYVITNGNFDITGGATVGIAAGVTFYLGGDTPGSVQWTNYTNTQWSMSAPASGPYAGILVYQGEGSDGSAPTNQVVGGSGLSINGTIYTPNAQLQVTNDAVLTHPADGGLGIIAQSINVQGSGQIQAGGVVPGGGASSSQIVLLQ